ncbi:hypothetical protein [Ekhidna sp.]|jgi:hypothetical protein|uniref:hypothetical protein n=1 Tax=Ekhidna sp. TaxID=2608089 RepID=UPI0032EE0EC6
MDISEVNPKKIANESLIDSLIRKEIRTPTKREKKELQKKIVVSVQNGDFISSINNLTLGVFFDLDTTLDTIKRKGIFRYSKYETNKCIVDQLASRLINIIKKLKVNPYESISYLESVVNISVLNHSFRGLRKIILHEIKNFYQTNSGRSLIKTLQAYTDYLFLSNHHPEGDDVMNINTRSKEQIAVGVSYLVYLVTETKKIRSNDTTKISEEWIINGKINKMILASCIIQDFKEFEVLIDHFKYQCVQASSSIKIIPPSANFEKTMKLGFIRSQIQGMNDIISVDTGTAMAIEDLVDKLYEYEDFKIFEYTESHDYPRYRIKIPEPIIDLILEKFFATDRLFKEEIISLSSVYKEQLINYNDLKKIIIKDDLSLMDFIKIHRLFTLFYHLFTKKIFTEKSTPETIIRSLITVFPENQFYELLEKIAPFAKVDTFLNLMSWEIGDDKLFDIQYHPILYLKESFLISLSVLVQSNSIRNLYASEYKLNNKNLMPDGNLDPLVEKLSDTFTKAGIENYQQVSIPDGEIDLIAIIEDTIFFFECKQSLHPTSIHDLRTTYDYIQKAITQLGKTKVNFQNGQLGKIIEDKLDTDLSDIKNDHYSIILSNRVLNGNEFDYPVRNINEIRNFILSGSMRTNQGEFSLWKDEYFQLSDLVEYLSLDSKLVKLMMGSFSSRTLKYQITNPHIEFEDFYWKWSHTERVLNEFTENLNKK